MSFEIYDAIVLGRGPLGVYTSTKLLDAGKKVLNIDAGVNLENLTNNISVESNILWKSKFEPPSLNKNASPYMWGGGVMGWPLESLGIEDSEIPIKEEDFISSVISVAEYLGIEDFDLTKNLPMGEQADNLSIKYTYLMKNYDFKDKIKYLENNSLYKFLDNTNSYKIKTGKKTEVVVKTDSQEITYSCKNLFICLGAIETSRLVLENSNLVDSKNSKSLYIEDHLRFPIAKFEISNLYSFKLLFDKITNNSNEKYLWPRFVDNSHKNSSYSFFKFWRYNNLIYRKLNLNFLKKRFVNSGSCELHLFVEKKDNLLDKMYIGTEKNLVVKFNLSQKEISKIEEIAKIHISKFQNEYGKLVKNIKVYDLNLSKEFLDKVETASHPSGSLKMGKNSETSYVDNESRLWEHPNIYVYGSATLPRPHYIHPTFVCLSLADYSLNKSFKL